MFFTVITKNLNWKILTKNLVTFKRWFFFVHKKKKRTGGVFERYEVWFIKTLWRLNKL